MLDVYSGSGQTLKNIVDDCERMAGNPQLNLDPTTGAEPIAGALKEAPAYRWLLDILRSLYLLHDWPFAIKGTTIAAPTGGRSISLPAAFYRIAFDSGMFLIYGNLRQQLLQTQRDEFFGPIFQQNNRGTPTYFYLDRGTGTMFLEPIPSANMSIEVHYFELPTAANSINDFPSFPHHDYLLQALLVRYYIDQDDQRAADAEALRVKLFQQMRNVGYDNREDMSQTVMLDPYAFPKPQWND